MAATATAAPASAEPKGVMGRAADKVARWYTAWARLMRLDKATIELATTSNFVSARTLFIIRAVLYARPTQRARASTSDPRVGRCAFMWCVWIASLSEGNAKWHIFFTYLSYTNTLFYFSVRAGRPGLRCGSNPPSVRADRCLPAHFPLQATRLHRRQLFHACCNGHV